jgi:hypothetical protein
MALLSKRVTNSCITSSNLDSFLKFLRSTALDEILRLLADTKKIKVTLPLHLHPLAGLL